LLFGDVRVRLAPLLAGVALAFEALLMIAVARTPVSGELGERPLLAASGANFSVGHARTPHERNDMEAAEGAGEIHERMRVVPRGGIEPPTPAFSEPCSTN
jgi:hypothetical protein